MEYENIKKLFKTINNNRVIKDTSCNFFFIESKEYIEYVGDSPFKDYFFSLSDLSINIMTNLKWVLWGYYFMKATSESVTWVRSKIKDFNEYIGKRESFVESYEDHKLFLDGKEIKNQKEFKDIIDNVYNTILFNENTKVCLKLKVNVSDFLLLQNDYIPWLEVDVEKE